jgi:hypothetical protein
MNDSKIVTASHTHLPRHEPQAFGQETLAADRLEDMRVKRVLARRLAEKARNYERAAAKLEIRGDGDAAEVLHRAADRLRHITAKPAKELLPPS